MDNKLPQNTSLENALPIMCVTNEYLWKDYILNVDNSLIFILQKFFEKKGKTYDALCFKKSSSGEEVAFYFDISSFYGKGSKGSIIPPSLDIPPHNSPFTLEDLFHEEGKWMVDIGNETGRDISSTKIIFKQYSSEMVSMYVAIWYWNQNKVEITPIRAYDKKTGVPILHGYYFWRMMFDHQLQHILDNHNVASTEIEVKGNYYQPLIGSDCFQFIPLPSFNFSNDLINYTLFTHRPKAFDNDFELRAFGASLHFGFSRNLFVLNEIKQSVINSKVDVLTQKNLLVVAKSAFNDV